MEAIVSPLRSFFQRLFKRWEKNPKDQQYFLKMLFAIISAVVCGLAGTSFAGLRGVMFGFLMYAASLFVIVYLLDIAPEDIGGRQKLVTDTLFSFLMLWVLLWTLIYTMIYPLAFGTLPIPLNSTLS
jgi:hypothetical protein